MALKMRFDAIGVGTFIFLHIPPITPIWGCRAFVGRHPQAIDFTLKKTGAEARLPTPGGGGG